MTASATAATTMRQPEGVERGDDLQADVRAEHVEGAVGQVEDPHDPERQRETGGQQEQDESIGQAVEPRHDCLAHSPPMNCRRCSPGRSACRDRAPSQEAEYHVAKSAAHGAYRLHV